MQEGKFITLEGGEGVGKSTLAKNLQSVLLSKGLQSVLTREPGGTVGAETIRSLILNPPGDVNWSATSQTLLFFAARRDHLENVIVPALKQGKWVICDRFTDSTRAYQEIAGGVSASVIDTLDEIIVDNYQPDLTLILDMELSEAAKRRQARNGPEDVFEKKPQIFHEKVRQAFLNIAQNNLNRCSLIDASQKPELVTKAAVNAINSQVGFL